VWLLNGVARHATGGSIAHRTALSRSDTSRGRPAARADNVAWLVPGAHDRVLAADSLTAEWDLRPIRVAPVLLAWQRSRWGSMVAR